MKSSALKSQAARAARRRARAPACNSSPSPPAASEERYRAFFEHNLDGVVSVDLEGRFKEANPAAQRISGYSADELRELSFIEICAPDQLQTTLQRFQSAIEGRLRDLETAIIRKDGRRAELFVTGSPVSSAGRVVGLFLIVRDITERKQVEMALRGSEARLAGIVGSAMDAIISVDSGQRIVLFNAAAERMFRCPAAQVMGQPLDQFLPESVRAAHQEHVRSFGQAGEMARGTGGPRTVKGRRADGQEFPIEASISQIETGGEKLFTVILRDITEREQAEKALQASQRQLRQFAQELERRVQERTAQLRALAMELTQAEERERRRLAQILHDHLQQMLFGARLHVDLLRGQNQEPAFLKHISQVGDLLTNCMELSRSLAQELSPAVLHDMGLAAGLKWLGRWMEQNHGLAVELALDDKAGPDDQQIRLVLFQSVRELLFNTVKHSGVRTARVQMKRFSDDQVQLVVSDQGAGFDPAQLKSASTGFGLHSIRERLELFGARLDIDSAAGRGSRFTLTAPLRPVADKSSKWA